MIQLVRSLFCCSLLVFTLGLSAQDIYQAPPPAIADLVTAPQTPLVSVNSSGEWLLLLERPGYRTIEDLAQPELKLAGLRINPRTNGASRGGTYSGLSLQHTIKGEVKPIAGLPDDVVVENVSWSPDGMHITFTVRQSNGLELWLAEVASSKARKLTEAIVNDALSGIPYAWFSDNKTLLVRTIVADRGEAPLADLAPAGPVVQATDGSKAPVRTYQDLLKNPHDEALFAYYATGQLQLLDLATGKLQAFGAPGIYTTMDVSPDGSYVLLGKLNKPFSYLVPYYRFPVTYTIYDRAGTAIREVADIPLAENIPKGFGAVRLGPRSFQWRADKPATLFWTEAQDGGDPRAEVDVRDQLFYLASPFQGDPQPSVKLPLRFGGVDWGNDELAIAYEWWWSTRQQISSQFVPDRPGTKEVLYEGSFEDRYNDPGSFVTRENKYGREVLLTSGKGQTLYLTGEGASPEGDRPFLRAFDRKTKTTKELWRSQAPYYEQPVALIGSPDEQQVILRRQSKAEAPNYYLYNWGKQDLKPLTTFPHPYAALQGIEKQVITYTREDGVQLQGDLYLPKGFELGKDEPLPTLLWAYPNEFKSADAASQVEGSPYEFIRLYWGSPLYWLTQGYAVLDNPGMPVIGEGDEEPNDSFRQQLVANAAAAIDKLVDMGVTDRARVGVGGHSYGAFMTANLLAHSDLFAAGIARSGAYNRTLTPFGFQAEERTYWEAPEVYYTMSPFMHADKVDEPILLIHGEADNNSGTFPLQSKRFYAAIKGLGGTARLVMLPYESHGYRAQESILHMLWEQHQWLERYVKGANAPNRP